MPALPAPDFPAEVRARLEADAKELIGRYPVARSALLPLLHLVQAEEGYVSASGIRFCAEQLELTTAEVTAVATFYTMYRRKPAGRYHVGVCTNTLCAVLGGDQIFAELKEHLGVENNETTEDGAISIEHIECNAACDYAPVMMVNWEFFDNQTPETAKRLVDDLRAGHTVLPSRGAALCTFKETARILAGFPDERAGALDASGAGGAPSLAGLRLARGETLPGCGTAKVVSPRHGTGAASEDSSAGAPSSHDAPQDTSVSDPAHPADPEGSEGR
ncbi:NADH-quinone oxidoreductase subunit NuoE [Peterkaempfera bronchialis]|uniref:NADH-quinone oxidoreductase subunit E n=1 Tax=Peterkaempfera bronchialis TaxID=2126346 RepID=A0A345T683_9ACTN|nr:NADH-quinone oxidoreductase subunit NuoE [Peterkaempfera bronchialis]AXI81488.1 NADH-quinone oxidoreductase subunit NuoE [Peterkaempfera bronchialis]